MNGNEATAVDPAREPGVDTRPKILAVDDREKNLFTMRQVLGELDAELITAGSGNEALSQTLRHEFAVILLDVQMPGMDGFETAALLRQREATRHVPIIFVTAISKEERFIFEGYRSGAVDYLLTPINPEILQSKVRVFLELHRQSRALELMEEIRRSREELRVEVDKRRQAEGELLEMSAELVRANEELRIRAEALEQSNLELKQFAYVASHDLQTPLRAISGFVQLLRRSYRGKLDAQADEWIERSVRGAEKMRLLIEGLLSYARVESRSCPFEPVDLREVFEDVKATLEASITDTGALVTMDELPVLAGDRGQLAQLLQNLVGNAIKYHGPERPSVHVSARRKEQEWILSVRDNGIGIADKHHGKIFEVFRRLHTEQAYPGTGIGLAICRRVVERHGGEIWVESEPGEGSCFFFTIPDKEGGGVCPDH